MKNLGHLTGGQCFVFWEADCNLHELISNEEVYVCLKDAHSNGSTKVVNLANGLLLQRDSDRKVVVLDATMLLSTIQ